MASGPTPHTSFIQEQAQAVRHEAVSSRYFRLVMRAPKIAQRATPGQFVLLSCLPIKPGLTDPLLPRPLALLDADPKEDTVSFLYFVAGRGTDLLRRSAEEALAAGPDALAWRLIGPLGKGFEPIDEVDVHVGVGGGSGVAPFIYTLF